MHAKLIAPDDVLVHVEFAGSDFHKNGKSVLFLGFQKPGGESVLQVVYKPSNLEVDAALIGTDHSLAQLLDPTGTEIPQYTILPVQHDLHDAYGYIEFVATLNPTSLEDMYGVARSIGAISAFAYLMGIEDMHHENVLLHRNRVQIIDVEATSGLFTAEGFYGMSWNLGVEHVLARVWESFARRRPPVATHDMSRRMRLEAKRSFTNTLERATRPLAGFQRAIEKLGRTRSRLIPITTSELFPYIRSAQRKTWAQWQAHIRFTILSTTRHQSENQILLTRYG